MKTLLRDLTAGRVARPEQTPRLPHRVALVNANPSDSHGATRLIIDDFAEAFEVYARLGAAPGSRVPQLTGFTWNGARAFDPRDLTAFDAVILGYQLHSDGLPSHAVELLDTIEETRALRSDSLLYAIADTEHYEPRSIEHSFRLLDGFCKRNGIRWSGGLAAGANNLIPNIAGSPRMGFLRRRLSEATDKLILAVRCGTDAGTIEARCPLPRFVYKFVTGSR